MAICVCVKYLYFLLQKVTNGVDKLQNTTDILPAKRIPADPKKNQSGQKRCEQRIRLAEHV